MIDGYSLWNGNVGQAPAEVFSLCARDYAENKTSFKIQEFSFSFNIALMAMSSSPPFFDKNGVSLPLSDTDNASLTEAIAVYAEDRLPVSKAFDGRLAVLDSDFLIGDLADRDLVSGEENAVANAYAVITQSEEGRGFIRESDIVPSPLAGQTGALIVPDSSGDLIKSLRQAIVNASQSAFFTLEESRYYLILN